MSKLALYFTFIILISFSWMTCSKSEIPEQPAKVKPSAILKGEKIYIFKKENQAEIWSRESLIQKIELSTKANELLIGYYEGKQADQIIKSFNKLGNKSISKLFVFPNDSKINGTLEPCFACPHNFAEIYAQLELEIFLSSQKSK